MKKLLTAMVMVTMFYVPAFGAAFTTVSTEPLNPQGDKIQVIYSGETVAASTTTEFTLVAPTNPLTGSTALNGKITAIRWEGPTGTDTEVWLAQTTSEAITGYDTIWSYGGVTAGDGCNLGCSSTADMLPLDFITAAGTLYWTVKNDDAANATGVHTLVVTYLFGAK
jgi:hypothetical protein